MGCWDWVREGGRERGWLLLGGRGLTKVLTEHFGDGDPDSEGRHVWG